MGRVPIFESYSTALPPPGPEMLPMSKPAVFGLLLSILQCLPVLSGLGAMILGVLGLREIRRGERVGKPIALAAIAIGALSTFLWVLALAVGGLGASRFFGAYELAERFTLATANGDFDRARQLAGPDVSDEKLAMWIQDLEVEAAAPKLEVQNLGVDEEGDVNISRLWNGPFVVTHRVDYRDGNGRSAGPGRRAEVWLEKVDGEFRVIDLKVQRSAPAMPQISIPKFPEQPVFVFPGQDEEFEESTIDEMPEPPSKRRD